MKQNSNILDELASKGDGMTVPEGYFENFAVQMSGKLPFREELDDITPSKSKASASTWMRIRPYVYMAAMFAGAWCLLKMFSIMNADPYDTNIDNYPALSEALQNGQFVNEYILDDLYADEIYQLMSEDNDIPLPDEIIDYNETDLGQSTDYILPGAAQADDNVDDSNDDGI